MSNQGTHFNYIILGAGPAGLQLGYYFEKDGEDYKILESGASVGTFFKKLVFSIFFSFWHRKLKLQIFSNVHTYR